MIRQALKVGGGDSQLDARIGVGPGGGLLEVGERHLPLAKLDVGSRPAEIGFRELGVPAQGERPFLDRGLGAAQCVESRRLVQMDPVESAQAPALSSCSSAPR